MKAKLFAVTSVLLAMFSYTPLFAIAEQAVGLWLYFALFVVPVGIAFITAYLLRKDGLKPTAIIVAISILLGLNIIGVLFEISILLPVLLFGVAAIIYGIRSLRYSKIEETEQRTAAMVGIVFGAVPLVLAAIATYILTHLQFTF